MEGTIGACFFLNPLQRREAPAMVLAKHPFERFCISDYLIRPDARIRLPSASKNAFAVIPSRARAVHRIRSSATSSGNTILFSRKCLISVDSSRHLLKRPSTITFLLILLLHLCPAEHLVLARMHLSPRNSSTTILPLS